jgi:hypothetical protein
VAFVVIGALSIIGSLLWKKANRLDPARKSETVRFFVQNQLGAIIAIIAFVPLIILVFMNKDMSGKQKGIAGAIGIVIAAVAAFIGVDLDPPSVEQYTADQSAVIQMLGKDEVAWTPNGEVYHACKEVSSLANSTEKVTGTTNEAIEAGKPRFSLNLKSDLPKCGLPVPENIDEIISAIEEIRDGAQGVVLPAPVYAEGVEAPFTPAS